MKKINFVFIVLLLNIILSNSASIGSATIDGKIYNQISMRPEFEFGKFGLGLDIYFYIDDEGNFYDKSWDFSNGKAVETLLDKVYYLKYNKPSDNFYFRVGGMPSVNLGYGILVNNYSNTIEYPNVRRLGLDLRVNSKSGINTQFILSDLKKLDGAGLMAARAVFPLASRLKIGVFAITDIDMTKGLLDSDDDGYPDYFDDFINDPNAYNNAEEIANNNGWGDELGLCTQAITAGTYTDYEDCYSTILSYEHNSFVPGETLEKDNISAIGLDFSLKLTKKISAYSQFAQMAGDAVLDNTYEGKLGWGAIPVGLGLKFGPDKLSISTNLEYRINSRHFMYAFWDQTYELNRAQVISDTEVKTKRNQLLYYGELSGFYFSTTISALNFIDLNLSYQDMKGESWDEENSDNVGESFISDGYFEDSQLNKSFLATLKFNTSRIPKLKVAEIYYERNNDPDPFDFDNPSTNTVHGYNLGYELSDGVILLYKGRTTYINDIISGEPKPNFSLQFETQIAI